MKSIGNKKAPESWRSRSLIDVNNYEVSQHDYYTTKSIKPKQPTFSYW